MSKENKHGREERKKPKMNLKEKRAKKQEKKFRQDQGIEPSNVIL